MRNEKESANINVTETNDELRIYYIYDVEHGLTADVFDRRAQRTGIPKPL